MKTGRGLKRDKRSVAFRKRVLGRLLAGLLLMSFLGALPLVAAESRQLHCLHEHDRACGYQEAVPAAACMDVHEHNPACGYTPAQPGAECTLSYEAQVALGIEPEMDLQGYPTWCHYIEIEGEIEPLLVHMEGCGYVEPV